MDYSKITVPPDYVLVPDVKMQGESASGLAIKIQQSGGKLVWVPLSQVHSQHTQDPREYVNAVVMKKWVASKNELDYR